MKVLIVNGVNINMIGKREAIYGGETLDELNKRIAEFASAKGVDVEFFQSNIEGEIVNRLQRGGYDGLIINAGAYSHYSYAIADALKSVAVKKIEVHITNILAREPFRRTSVTSESCDGCVTGMGTDGYLIALEYLTWRK